jgi:hypothetical protein
MGSIPRPFDAENKGDGRESVLREHSPGEMADATRLNVPSAPLAPCPGRFILTAVPRHPTRVQAPGTS